jgi:hypothetical protein
MRRRWVWIVGGLGVVVGTAIFLLLIPSSDRVTVVTCNEINEGMGEAEVERLLGRPPDAREERDGLFVSRDLSTGRTTDETRYTSFKVWDGPRATITVYFRDGVVVKTDYFAEIDESLLKRLRQMVGLP